MFLGDTREAQLTIQHLEQEQSVFGRRRLEPLTFFSPQVAALVDEFFLFPSGLFITFPSLAPCEMRQCPSHMSYRLTFSFLSWWTDYLIFVLLLTELSGYVFCFVFKSMITLKFQTM